MLPSYSGLILKMEAAGSFKMLLPPTKQHIHGSVFRVDPEDQKVPLKPIKLHEITDREQESSNLYNSSCFVWVWNSVFQCEEPEFGNKGTSLQYGDSFYQVS
jgi:hypothetical protein